MKEVLNMDTHTCCFIGHRKTEDTVELRQKVEKIVEKLITDKNVDTFLFGSKSAFNSLCYEIVTEKKKKHSQIKRIFVRAEYPDVPEWYEKYLLQFYEESYYPENVRGAGRASYIKRNREMIDKSEYCIIHFCESIKPKNRKSGTEIALKYAESRTAVIKC